MNERFTISSDGQRIILFNTIMSFFIYFLLLMLGMYLLAQRVDWPTLLYYYLDCNVILFETVVKLKDFRLDYDCFFILFQIFFLSRTSTQPTTGRNVSTIIRKLKDLWSQLNRFLIFTRQLVCLCNDSILLLHLSKLRKITQFAKSILGCKRLPIMHLFLFTTFCIHISGTHRLLQKD